MSRVTDRDDWAELWEADHECILRTMYKNMASDLECGYNPFGASIQRQKTMIAEYEKQIHQAWDKFVYMTDAEVNRWCFYDMKKRGAIA